MAIAVIEVGIGGRFDTTNVLKTMDLSVITSVDLDHTQMLGRTEEEIAFEKSGIMRPGVPCVCGDLGRAARRVVEREAGRLRSPLVFAADKPRFSFKGIDWRRGRTLLGRGRGAVWRLGLLGAHQAVNANITARCAELLGGAGFEISDSALKSALAAVVCPGRFELLRRGEKTFIFDGGHNPQAARSFVETFRRSPYASADVCFLLGVMKDKDFPAIARILAPCIKKAAATAPPSSRALDPLALADCLSAVKPDIDIEVHQDYRAALRYALKSDVVAVAGSFYLVGSVKSCVDGSRNC